MTTAAVTRKKNPAWLLLIFLVFLISGPEFATDMYVPSLPSIATSLHILKSSAALTITAYLLGMAISQFFYGSISDAYGRKKTLLISSLVCLVGNIICMVSHHFATLVVGRVIQGAGAGASVSMCLAIARDVYEGPTLARAFSILFAFYFAVFGCAPIVGGYLEHYLNWRYNFVILTIYFAIQFFWVLLIYQETYVNTGTHQRLSLKTSLLNYWQLIKSRIFVGNLLACTLTYCGLFAYIAITPFLFQKRDGVKRSRIWMARCFYRSCVDHCKCRWWSACKKIRHAQT